VKTVEMACGDLERYHKALEKALLAFHTNKMTDINKVGGGGGRLPSRVWCGVLTGTKMTDVNEVCMCVWGGGGAG
jgi:hypothetical protein